MDISVIIPAYNVPLDYMSGALDLVESWIGVGNKKRATEIADELWKQSEQFLAWYISNEPSYLAVCDRDCKMHIYIMQAIMQVMDKADESWSEKHTNALNLLYGAYQQKLGVMP